MAGSQAYVPKDPKDDKALHVAEDLLRGKDVNPDALSGPMQLRPPHTGRSE